MWCLKQNVHHTFYDHRKNLNQGFLALQNIISVYDVPKNTHILVAAIVIPVTYKYQLYHCSGHM